MKNTIFTIIAFLLLSAVAGCDNMNDLHQKYLDEGPRIYIGKPDSVTVKPGFKKIRLIWTNNADAKIKKTRIFYNYGNDSITIPFVRKNPGFQKDSITLDLEAGDYIFDICNLTEDESLRSMVVPGIIGKVYGDNDQLLLSTRSFTTIGGSNSVNISWGNVTSEYLYSIVRLKNHSTSAITEIICDNNTYETLIENVTEGDELSITSAYKPEKNYMEHMESLPEVITNFVLKEGELEASQYVRYTQIPFDNITDHAGWSPFSALFDKRPGDAWLSNIGDANSANNHQFPISISIDLGAPLELNKVQMFMVPGQEFKEDHPKKFEIWGTGSINKNAENEYWTTTIPGAWQNDWHKLADCEALPLSGQSEPTDDDIASAAQGFTYNLDSSVPVRYVRVVIKETWGTAVQTRMGDLLFSGKYLKQE